MQINVIIGDAGRLASEKKNTTILEAWKSHIGKAKLISGKALDGQDFDDVRMNLE